jgi:hypothetical protein
MKRRYVTPMSRCRAMTWVTASHGGNTGSIGVLASCAMFVACASQGASEAICPERASSDRQTGGARRSDAVTPSVARRRRRSHGREWTDAGAGLGDVLLGVV